MTDTAPKLNFGKRIAAKEAATDQAVEGSEKAQAMPVVLPKRLQMPIEQPAPSQQDAFNPMLDDEDEGSQSPMPPVAGVPISDVNPMLDDDDETTPVPKPREGPTKHDVQNAPPKAETNDASEREHKSGPSKSAAQRRPSKRPSRFLMTEEYLSILTWMDKARYTSNEQVAVYMDRDLEWTRKSLGQLMTLGYVRRKKFPGYPTAFYLTATAKDVVDSNTKAVEDATGPRAIRHTLSVGWLMLGFLKNQLVWSQTAAKALGRPVELHDFVGEPELMRATNQRFGQTMTQLEIEAKKAKRKTLVQRWEAWEALAVKASQVETDEELDETNLFAWAAYVTGGRPHYPDLILRLPRSPSKDVARSIAFEVERSQKPASVESILSSFVGYLAAEDADARTARYHMCAWVCGDEHIRDLVKAKVGGRYHGHKAQLERTLAEWKVPYLANIEAEAQAVREANHAARSQRQWHVTSNRNVTPCLCGVECRSRYGRYATQQQAQTFVGEMA